MILSHKRSHLYNVDFVLISIFFSVLWALKLGNAVHGHVWEDFQMYQIIKNHSNYSSDLFAYRLIPSAGPILQYVFQYFYEIPFAHLFIGLLLKSMICYVLIITCFKISNDFVVTIISVSAMMFLIPSFVKSNPNIFNFDILSTISRSLFLSFRDFSILLNIIGFYFYLLSKRAISILLLSFSFLNHPTSTINVFLIILISDLIINFKLKKESFFKFSVYLFFLIPIAYKINLIQNIDFGFNAIPFQLHWENIWKNEPDDISTLYWVKNYLRSYIKYFILLVGSLIILVRQNKLSDIKNKIRIILIIIPILTFSLALYEEYIFHYFPDLINDFIMPLQLRRAWGLISIVCVPLVIVFIKRNISRNIILNKYYQRNKNLIIMSFFFFISLNVFYQSFKNNNYKNIFKMIDFDRHEPEFFYKISNDGSYFFGTDREVMGEESFIEFDSLISICNYIKKNTASNASFIFPPYIKTFRYLSNRPGFCSEKNDGNYSGLNRKFASRYYEQIKSLTGIQYNSLSEAMHEGGLGYKYMREKFLLLKENEIRDIMERFNKYDYFFTEKKHNLNYPVIFSNKNFIIYEIIY
tara:strand:- start:499 stop:2244 length:1746 start_codon:yes stop_codon:yes gene_type:complete